MSAFRSVFLLLASAFATNADAYICVTDGDSLRSVLNNGLDDEVRLSAGFYSTNGANLDGYAWTLRAYGTGKTYVISGGWGGPGCSAKTPARTRLTTLDQRPALRIELGDATVVVEDVDFTLIDGDGNAVTGTAIDAVADPLTSGTVKLERIRVEATTSTGFRAPISARMHGGVFQMRNSIALDGLPVPTSSSPAIDSGRAVDPLFGANGTVDYLGRPRKVGSAYDRGAIELDATAPATGDIFCAGFEDGPTVCADAP